MTSCREVLDTVAGWLRQGSVDAKNLVDFPWEVNVHEKGLKAIYPKFPVDVTVTCDERMGFLRLAVALETETLTLDKDTKLLVYHKLLRRNAAPLIKYALTGDEAIPTLMVDLSIKSLGKEEFNDALAVLLAAVNDIINILGLEEYYKERMFLTLLGLVRKHIEEGWGRERIYEYLTRYAGLRDEEAQEIVSSMLEQRGRGRPSVYV